MTDEMKWIPQDAVSSIVALWHPLLVVAINAGRIEALARAVEGVSEIKLHQLLRP